MHPTNCRVHTNSAGDSRPEQDAGGGGAEAAGFRMTPETHKAIEAVRFIAAHLKNEDDYAEVRPVPVVLYCFLLSFVFLSFILSLFVCLFRAFVTPFYISFISFVSFR